MSVENPSRVVTKQDLADFYQSIFPYLGGTAATGFTPVGTIIAVFAETAPANYLICDGSTYNKADYPQLAGHLLTLTNHSAYEVDGDSTKFKVPDLRGEFLRGTGTNSHKIGGNGAAVGVHQEGSAVRAEWLNPNGSSSHTFFTNVEYQRAISTQYPDNVLNPDKVIFRSYITGSTGLYERTIGASMSSIGDYDYGNHHAVRPTNTSVLFCIAVKNIVMGEGVVNYSLDEQVVGTWVDGKPLYQKTFTITAESGKWKSYTLGTDCIVRELIGIQNASARETIPSFNTANTNDGVRIVGKLASTEGAIGIYATSAWYEGEYYITAKYTKTTD